MIATIRNASLCAAALALVGCTSQEPPKQPTSRLEAEATTPRSTATQPAKSSDTGQIVVQEEIAKRCKLPESYFAFDSAKITGDAAKALDVLARCFTQGELANATMKIVGHADPRGTLEYNFALGQRRAGSVEDYLANHGLDRNRMVSSSMGELEATGTDEAGWRRDRNVEILLGDEVFVLEKGKK